MGFGYPDECLWQVRSQNATPYELQLPIHLGFSCGISRNVRFRVALGPYFAVGLFGKGKSHYTIYGETNEDTKHISHPISNIYTDDTYAMNRFEVGLDSKIGVEVKRHYLVALGYQLQINNPSSSFCPIRQSQVFSINFGYKF